MPARRLLPRLLPRLGDRLVAFRAVEEGQIAIIFALLATMLITATGGGIDLMRAFQARQKLGEVAAMACQYASRPSIIKMAAPNYSSLDGNGSYSGSVNSYINAAIATQQVGLAQTNAAPFTYVTSGPADVQLNASMPTAFTSLIGITQIPLVAKAHCYDSPANIQSASVPDASSPYVLNESFEARGTPTQTFYNDYAFYTPGGRSIVTPSSDPTSLPAYTGGDGTKWYVTGHCLEIDHIGVISSTVPDGQFTAELDCDSTSSTGSANDTGNSAISTRKYLAVGNYELRYYYRSRVGYPTYDPTYLCGSKVSQTGGDLSFANDATAYGAVRTNQVNVYLDLAPATGLPLHPTIDGTQQLGGTNLIDFCVYSAAWIERSVRIYVSTPGEYWLSFAADGQDDSKGGQIDKIRLCIQFCPGALQDNFPGSWLAANNGGVNKVLFQDGFESPPYTQDPYITYNRTKGGNLTNSNGTTGTPQSGWPSQSVSGWATGPYNQVNIWLQDAYQGSQYVSLQGWSGFSSGSDTINRLISRKFLLVPGYYNVSYGYTAMTDFSTTIGAYGTVCSAAPASGSIYPYSPTQVQGRPRYASSNVAVTVSTNILGVFLSNGQLVSTLNPNTTMGVANNGSPASTTGGQASYTNPNGTVTTTPTNPPDKVNWASYDATVSNPVIDTCGYSSGYTWVPRSANVKVAKAGWYWLTFSAQGDEVTGTGNGPVIDDVKLTALGSPSMISPPAPVVAIPVPDPQPDSRVYFNGFFIVADPLIPPVALQ